VMDLGKDAEDWTHLVANVFLVHRGIWLYDYFPFLFGDWWLCYFVMYLLTWAPMHTALHLGKDGVLWTVFTIATVVVFPSVILEWYFMWGIPFFQIIQLWPSFVFGEALAHWFVRHCMQVKEFPLELAGPSKSVYVLRPVDDVPLVVRFGVTLSFVVFGLMFFLISPFDKLPVFQQPVQNVFVKGLQLPIQGFMISGFAFEADPIAKLFARRPFRWTGKLALMNYIFHVPVYNSVNQVLGWEGLTWTFSAVLVATTVVAHFALEQPWRKFYGASPK